jgi:hypothetical protein
VLFAVVAATLALVPEADARGYTCRYDMKYAYVTIDGSDNSPVACRAFNQGAKGRRVSYAPGSVVCAWRMRAFDIRSVVTARNRSVGKVFCALMAQSLGSGGDWVRTR